jgi:hypothetical protein
MDPKAVQRAQEAFMQAMHKLNVDYIRLMQRLGCKTVTLHRF